jgi:protein-histidine pros-kinase
VQSGARHLLSLINDLLDLAKIEAGKLELSREAVDCRQAVEEVAASMRVLAERKGLQFLVTLPDKPAMASANRRALNQILFNLVSNAVKYTERGSVRLRVDEVPAAPHATVPTNSSTILMSVEDTGPGIRPEDRKKLFEAFSRIASEQNSSPGTGLGLHLSLKLAELQEGHISCRSEYGLGSTFTLELPQQEE